MTSEIDNFEIKIATENERDAILKYVRRYFYLDEPLNKYLNEKRRNALVEIERGRHHGETLKEGLSFIAVSSNNEIIGLTVNTNSKEKASGNIAETHPNYSIIRKMLNKFEDELYSKIRKLNEEEKELEIKIISTHPDWRNKKVGSSLAKETIEFAKQNNFSRISVICTSAYSAKLFQKLGFETMHTLNYKDYLEDGEIVFKPILPHTHLMGLVLEI